MEMTVSTLTGLNQHIDFQQQVAIQAALGNTRIGLLPGAPFNNAGTFVRNTFEISHFQCMALLPSGRIIHADEPVVVSIPMLYGNVYYLTIAFGEGLTEFEKDGVPYVRPQYVYAIETLEDIEGQDRMPIARFQVREGIFSFDPDYIPPTLQLVCDSRFEQFIQQLTEQLDGLTRHDHMVSDLGKRALLHYLFLLKSYNRKNTTADFVTLTQELAQAVDYYIMEPNLQDNKPTTHPQPSQYDVEQWLRWVVDYLKSALSVLDKAEIDDNTIDFEALKQQIKSELYAQMTPELHDQLKEELRAELTQELVEKLRDTLTDYIENTLRPTLHDQLKEELSSELYQQLYDALYQALYDALHVPVVKEEEDIFMPLI